VRRLHFLLLAAVAGCGAARPPVAAPAPSPGPRAVAPTSAPASRPAPGPADITCGPGGDSTVYAVGWAPEVRAALEAALERGGVAVVYDCARLRLLPGCRTPGGYGYMPTVPTTRPLKVTEPAEVRANLPPASVGAGPAAAPAPVDLALTFAGFRDLERASVAPDALRGDCAGATHVVRRAVIGFIGERREATACFGGAANADRPPAGCSAVLRLTLEPLGGGAPEALGVAGESCPAGFVENDGACRQARADRPQACTRQDPAGCARECERQHAGSCNTLGFLTRTGARTAADLARAATLFARACELGSADGCANYGLALHAGRGLARDPTRAAAVFGRACELGHATACAHFGLLFESGDGIPRDPDRAALLFARACTAGRALGCRSLAGAYLHGSGVARDPARARTLLVRTCDLGERTGCLFLGVMLRDGLGGPPDRARGAALIHAACEEGLADACAEERAR
jgi:hypothetical protein